MRYLNLDGWNSHVHRGFPGKFESSNVSRDNISREIGRTARNRGDLRITASRPKPNTTKTNTYT